LRVNDPPDEAHRQQGNDSRGLFCNPPGLNLIYINSS
jgi:hypothetical protein